MAQGSWRLMKDLGTDVLPAVNVGLKGLDSILHGLIWLFDWKKDSKQDMVESGRNSASGSFDYWKKKLGFGSDPIPPAAQQGVTVNHQTTLDGRVIAESTTKYQVDGLATVSPSGNNYDVRMTPLVPGY
jgi:hypothetical protein